MKYSISSRLIHWFMALIIISLLVLGIYMADFLPEDSQNKYFIYNLHKSFGVLALALIVIRIINRYIYKAPSLSNEFSQIEKIATHTIHILLYVLMIAVPVSGYLMSNAYGYPVHFFNVAMPNLISAMPDSAKFFAKMHKFSAYALLFLIILHFLAALKHRFFDKPEKNVLNKMI